MLSFLSRLTPFGQFLCHSNINVGGPWVKWLGIINSLRQKDSAPGAFMYESYLFWVHSRHKSFLRTMQDSLSISSSLRAWMWKKNHFVKYGIWRRNIIWWNMFVEEGRLIILVCIMMRGKHAGHRAEVRSQVTPRDPRLPNGLSLSNHFPSSISTLTLLYIHPTHSHLQPLSLAFTLRLFTHLPPPDVRTYCPGCYLDGGLMGKPTHWAQGTLVRH